MSGVRRRAQTALGVDPDLAEQVQSLADRIDAVGDAARRTGERNAAEIRDVLADLGRRLTAIESRLSALEADRHPE